MTITIYIRALVHRIIKPALWRWFRNARASKLTDDAFRRLFAYRPDAAGFLEDFHGDARFRYFFHPRNQKDFFLHLLTQAQPHEDIVAEAEDVLTNHYEALGSGRRFLGEPINWRRDFKSGKVWPLKPLSAAEIVDAGNPSDIKLVWELNRFHQALWLGRAYWLTHNEAYAQKFGQLVDHWIAENPPGKGPNWFGAMEVAIRACNWIAGYYFFCESRSLAPEFWLRFFKSLYAHGIFIENHLEYSKRNGNHLLSDIVGLITLGVFFRSTQFGRRWIRWSVEAIQEEMQHQVTSDGVDYEKSIGYQRLVLELLYTATILCQKNTIPLGNDFMQRLERMFEFTLAYTRPDGSVPNVGDADDGRLFRFSARENFNDHRDALSVGSILFRRADFRTAAGSFAQNALWLLGAEGFEQHQMLHPIPPTVVSRAFRDGGFYVMQSSDAHMFVDAGDLGMRGRGGHGHNDTLSFELWCDGSPLMVDSGTFVYTADVQSRNEFRSTRSHNTLIVDDAELAEFAGPWAVKADPTQVRVTTWAPGVERDILEAGHFAYARLPNPVTVRRRFTFNRTSFSVVINDTVGGRGMHLVESMLHFAPDVSLEIGAEQKAIATKGNSRYIITVSAGDLSKSETWYSPSYGVREKKWTLRVARRTSVPAEIEIRIEKDLTA